MKNRVVKINDISDVDTSKISVYELANRYVDSRGNFFGLRYDRVAKRVVIIKLMRTHSDSAEIYEQKVAQKKLYEIKLQNTLSAEKPMHEPSAVEEIENKKFEPDEFITAAIATMGTHKNRYRTIAATLKNSNVISRDNKEESLELDDIFRNIDIENANIEKIEGYQKELLSYPRSITYYQAKLDKKATHILESIGSDSQRMMKYIYYYEMFNAINHQYKILLEMIRRLNNLLLEKDPEEIKFNSPAEKQYYVDARTSIKNTQSETGVLMESLKTFEAFIYNPDNFKLIS